MSQKKTRNSNKNLAHVVRIIYPHILPLILILLAAGIFFWVGNKLYCFFMEDKYFDIKNVRLVEGEAKLKSDQICRLSQTQNVFKIDIRRLADSLKENYSDIHEAVIYKVLPDTLIVEISRSIPAAQLCIKNKYYVIDIGGFIISKAHSLPIENLPMVFGLNEAREAGESGRQIKDVRLNEVLSLIKTINQVKLIPPYNQITKYDAVNLREIKFYTQNLEIVIGPKSNATKIEALNEVLKKLPKQDTDIKAFIDLRFKNVIVKT